MALLHTEQIENGLLGIWEITEEIEDLLPLANLSEYEFGTWNAFKAVQRKREWLATRALLNELTGSSIRIGYHLDGRPFLENYSMNISISHTKSYAAVLLHNKANPGIDIEIDSRSAEKVAMRILTSDELESCRENTGYSNKRLLIHWCAKEAIFKMVPENSISYSKEIHVCFTKEVENIVAFFGTFQSPAHFINISLFYKSVGELILVWGWPIEN